MPSNMPSPTNAVELGRFSIQGGMRSVEDMSKLDDQFSAHLTIYVNGFCKSAQINWAIDNDVEPCDLLLWHQRIHNVKWMVQEAGPIQEVTLIVDVSFEAFEEEGKELFDLPVDGAAEMARAAVYSFLHSYPLFYG